MTLKCKPWTARIDSMPPKPKTLYVNGEIEVGNPGVVASLTKREPQGINASILILDLTTHQKPGNFPQQVTWVKVDFSEEVSANVAYGAVEIQMGGERVAFVDHIEQVS